MMGNTSRVIATVAGQPSKILRIDETGDGTLIIAPARPTQISRSDDFRLFEDIRDWRISVHVSAGANGHTIKLHHRYGSGLYMRYYAFLERTRARPIWPISMIIAQDLSLADYRLKPRDQKDRLLDLGAFDSRTNALMYCIIISDLDTKFRPPDGFRGAALDFRHFRFHILWGLMSRPSSPKGAFNQLVTSWTLEDAGLKIDSSREPAVASFSRGELLAHIRRHVPKTADTHLALIQDWLGCSRTLSSDEIKILSSISSSPTILSEEANALFEQRYLDDGSNA